MVFPSAEESSLFFTFLRTESKVLTNLSGSTPQSS